MEQGDAILFFNEYRHKVSNGFFRWFTKAGEGISYLGFILYFLFVRYRYSLLVILAGFLATVVSFLLKWIFQHPRPAIYFRDAGSFDQIITIDGVHLLSGYMSFPSGHTTSAFVLFGLLAFLFARKWYWNVALFIIALLIGISRIYLVQHFLKDVYAGAITGTLLAMFIYWFNSKLPDGEGYWFNRSIRRNTTSPKNPPQSEI
ncbi:MAG TPA: phosphatase PAP2 family protein [Phaeodactylibacter sp.]|nr:phosphatase PAP2 family protein [Phaeodactylibacter sp.]